MLQKMELILAIIRANINCYIPFILGLQVLIIYFYLTYIVICCCQRWAVIFEIFESKVVVFVDYWLPRM